MQQLANASTADCVVALLGSAFVCRTPPSLAMEGPSSEATQGCTVDAKSPAHRRARCWTGWYAHHRAVTLVIIIYIVAQKAGLLRIAPARQCKCDNAGVEQARRDIIPVRLGDTIVEPDLYAVGAPPVLPGIRTATTESMATAALVASASARETAAAASATHSFAHPRRTASSSSSSASASSSSSGSTAASSGDGHASHPHEAMFFLIGSLIIGTVVTHLMTLPMFKGLQHSVILFVLGVIYSLVQEGLKVSEHLGVVGRSHGMWMDIDPHLLLFTMLPPLVTGDAMTIDTSVARRVAKQCMYLAGPGVCTNAFVTASFLYVYLPYDWSFLLCLTTGAILCATDPVAVVGLLKELGASPTLTVQIQGESLLNDGTAIVLYTISYDMLKGEKYDTGDVIQFLVKMAIYAWGLGMIIGFIFFSWIKAASNKLDHNSTVIQASLTICCAYSSFVIAEGAFHISGVLATVASALVLAHKMWPFVVSKHAMHDVWHMLEYLGNTIIFFLAGALTGSTMLRIHFEDYVHLLVIYMAATFFRGGLLFFSRPLLRHLGEDKQPITAADALVMTWGGLRGAIGLALAIQVQVDRAGGKLSKMDADRVLFYTSGIAALTLMVNATSCPALVKWLGITQLPATKRKMLQILNRQLLALSLEKPHPTRVKEAIHVMLDQVDHHIGAPGHSRVTLNQVSGDPMEVSSHRRISIDSDDIKDEFSQVPLLTVDNNTAAMVTVQAGHKIVAEIQEAKQKLASEDALHLLSDLPTMPFLEQEPNMMHLAGTYVTEPAIQRAINEAFFALVRTQYWRMVEHGEFASFAGEAEHLLASIMLAFSKPHYDLTDWSFIEPYIRVNFEASQGRLSIVHQETTKTENQLRNGSYSSFDTEKDTCVHNVVESTIFNVGLAFTIVSNSIFVYVEQAVRDEDEQGGVGWLSVDIFFNSIFTIEFILKFTDQRLQYFTDGWNIFDFCLVLVGLFGLVVNIMVDSLPNLGGSLSSSEARLVRIAQIFRMMRIVRLFRLVKFWRIVKSKLFGSHISAEVAEHMQKTTILAAFIRAHIASQQALVKYFGRGGTIDTVEMARTILQSQISVYKAMLMEIDQKQQLDERILSEVKIATEARQIAEELEEFIVDAHSCGVISSNEAEGILHPIHHHVKEFCKVIMDSQSGRISFLMEHEDEDADSSTADEKDTALVRQIKGWRNEESKEDQETENTREFQLGSAGQFEGGGSSEVIEPTDEPAPEPREESGISHLSSQSETKDGSTAKKKFGKSKQPKTKKASMSNGKKEDTSL